MTILDLVTNNFHLSVDSISGSVQQLSYPGDPLATNFVINATSHPAFNVTDSRWLGDLIFCTRPAGSNDYCREMVSGLSADTRSVSQNGNTISVTYNGSSVNPAGFSGFNVLETWTADNDVLRWTTTVQNTSPTPLEFMDVGFPLMMNSYWNQGQDEIYQQNVGRHSYIAEEGSYIYWGRPNGVAPFLLMTMGNGTSLEFKNKGEPGEGPFGAADPQWEGVQEFYVHSKNVVPNRVQQSGTYLPTTSVIVPKGGAQSFNFEFRWPKSYSDMHNAVYAAGSADIISFPGMTVPTDIPVTLAVRAQGGIVSVAGESGKNVKITSAGVKNGYNVYQFSFPGIGPYMITVTYAGGKRSVMQYQSIRPVKGLIASQASFLVNHQQAHTNRSYNGAFLQYDLAKKQLITWDNYPGGGWEEWMAGGSDDLGLSPAEFLSLKNTIFPVQSEVTAVDLYIDSFLLGYLQNKRDANGNRTWEVYRWFDGQDGTPSDQGTWRTFNYIHVANTYFHMYKVKKNFPSLTTSHSALDYLTFSFNTLNTCHTLYECGGAVGLMGESTYPEILAALTNENQTQMATTLNNFFKAKYQLLSALDYPFASEITIDTTGFETSFTLSKMYGNPQLENKVQLASLIARGTSPVWYWYGSDDRSMGESWWNLGYETQIGAWVQQEYLLGYGTSPAPDRVDMIRSTYGAQMAGWSNINAGHISSDPATFGAASWIYQSQLGTNTYGYIGLANGWWTWSGEASLGFWGGLRSAAVGVVNDPILGLYAYNGAVTATSKSFTVVPNDGVQQRIILWNVANVDIRITNAQYTTATISNDLTSFQLTLQNPLINAINTQISVARLPSGSYTVNVGGKNVGTMKSDGSTATIAFGATITANTQVVITKQSRRKRA